MKSGNTRVKVLWITPLPPPYAGVGKISLELLESELSEKCQIRVIDFSKRRRLRVQTFKVELYSIVFALRVWTMLLIQLVTFRPRVVYLASSYDLSYLRNVLLMATARICGRKVICHFHGRRSGALFGANLERLLGLTSLACNTMIYLSENLRNDLARTFHHATSVVIPNVVDVTKFEISRGLTTAPLRVIFVGRLSRDKGIEELLGAAAELKRRGTRFALDLVGIGETEEEERSLHSFCRTEGLETLVAFHGVRISEELAKLYSASALFVLPSRLEIFPVAILEAYASGVPVVATRVGAIPEILHDGRNGFLVPVGDANALTERMQDLLLDDNLRKRIGATNRTDAETLYHKHIAVERLLKVIRDL